MYAEVIRGKVLCQLLTVKWYSGVNKDKTSVSHVYTCMHKVCTHTNRANTENVKNW